MESKKMIRIAMKISEAIIEILKEEFGDNKKGRSRDENKERHVKRNRKTSR